MRLTLFCNLGETQNYSQRYCILIPTRILLWKFTFNRDNNSKHLSILLIHITFCKVSFQKKILLSTKCSKETFTTTIIPENRFFIKLCLIRPDNPLTTIRNKKGAKGSPYLKPLCILNYYVGLPLTNIEIVPDSTDPLIHIIHFWQKPSLPII